MSGKREELIREARQAVLTMDYERAYQGGLVGRLADALESDAVFEQSLTPTNDEREALRDEFRSYLGDEVYVCSRDHSAWSHSTMGLDDFSLAADDDEIIESLVDIALRRPAQGEPTDANQVSDEVADAAQIAMHEFCFGDEEPIGRLSVARQGWKVAIAAALRAAFATEQGGNRV